MSSVGSAEHAHEIIIVKHGGGDHDDGHHGGAWKIAFADFMTAMMCFFLVMWLINAANEQTQTAVASYFNPVKLVDRNSSRKGLDDMTEKPSDLENASEKAKEAPEKPAKPQAKQNDSEKAKADNSDPDQKLFADPYAVLSEIASNTDTQQNVNTKGVAGAQAAGPSSGADGGESFRDPFAPDFWSQQVESTEAPDQKSAEVDTRMASTGEPTAEAAQSADAPKNAKPATGARAGKTPANQSQANQMQADQAQADQPPVSQTLANASSDAANDQQDAKESKPPQPQKASKAVKAEAKAIETELSKALGEEKLEKGLSVTATPEGVLISLTDELNYGMFQIGSAVPNRELVLAMEKIAKVVSDHKGSVVIHGHTDGRQFHNEKYDNWRLSSARAQSAYYMLARGGLAEKRITEVAGFADRKLKVPDDPMAAANRRIEILLETGG